MPYRIIVADPSPSVQKVAQMVFTEPEFRIFLFEDGASLLEAAEDVHPDAVLVSLSLTARGGGEIGRALRSCNGLETVPLLGLKGTFDSPDMDKIEISDYDVIVRKPFDSERLAASVRDLISRKTGPSTLPEEPIESCSGEDAASSDAPGERPGDMPALADPELREWFHGEIVGIEREIEKRVRARLLAELREWMSRGNAGTGKKE